MPVDVWADSPQYYFPGEPCPNLDEMTWDEAKALINNKYGSIRGGAALHMTEYCSKELIRRAHNKECADIVDSMRKRMGEKMIEIIRDIGGEECQP